MRTYTFNELKKIAKDQNYKSACLENSQGNRVYSFNPQKVDIIKHLGLIEKRLTAEIIPNGCYYVCMANNVPRQKDPDKYPILKGSKEAMSDPIVPIPYNPPTPEVLTWGEALKLHQELAQLREENKSQKTEIELLKAEIDEINTEALSDENTPSTVNNLTTFLKEQSPVITGALDEWFKIKNRALNIEEQKIKTNGINPPTTGQNNPQLKRVINITPGSKEHLTLIEHWYNKGNEERMNIELDKLQAHDPEQYQSVLTKLNLTESE